MKIEFGKVRNYPRFFLFVFISIFTFFSLKLFADSFSSNSTYQVCFTPYGKCTLLIQKAIEKAKQEVLVQAYSFTSRKIAKALVDAQRRGVKVMVILDKGQARKNDKYVVTKFLIRNRIPVWIDYKNPFYSHMLAHNKVIIIDKCTVETGSFNFTKSAERRNAENVLIIKDCKLRRRSISKKID